MSTSTSLPISQLDNPSYIPTSTTAPASTVYHPTTLSGTIMQRHRPTTTTTTTNRVIGGPHGTMMIGSNPPGGMNPQLGEWVLRV